MFPNQGDTRSCLCVLLWYRNIEQHCAFYRRSAREDCAIEMLHEILMILTSVIISYKLH